MTQQWEHLLREIAPQVLASLTRRYHDFAAAEDAVQEAMLAAIRQWPSEGVPENARAWLMHVASRRMTDQIRADVARRNREAATVVESGYPMPVDEIAREDDTLALMFLCCHPALTPSSAIALTLRAVGGLTTAEIASAFLVPESTMAQRISRAKQSIKASGAEFEMPGDAERSERLRAVLHVIYLMFNEGYVSSSGDDLLRADLSTEALRLGSVLHRLLPAEPEVAGLLALMLLTDARRLARVGSQGEPIPLDEQDRSLWNQAQIREGVSLVSSALQMGAAGPYQLQAAIAAVHDEAPSAGETDWAQILALYDLLASISTNPVIRLNRAVAVAMVQGCEAGLRVLEEITPELGDNHRLAAVRGHLLEQSGARREAIESYLRAARLTSSLPERNYLLERAARLRP